MMFDTFPLRQKRTQPRRTQPRSTQPRSTQPRRPQRRQPQSRQLGNLWATLLILVVFLLAGNIGIAQVRPQKPELRYRGQLSTWGGYASGSEWPVMLGARYLPQLNLDVPINWRTPGGDSGGGFWGGLRFDAEVSGNMYGSGEIIPFSNEEAGWDARWDGKVKLYRGWGRVSTDRAELRVGLQKINFGSAMMLRPLMWFDSMDPRDPLQMTDGVWGAMGRYYFNNNANVWVWGLLGNSSRRALDVVPSDGGVPEFGGRVQVPVGKGEMAFTFHRRKTDSSGFGIDLGMGSDRLCENKFGLDMRFDYEIGFWLEAMWINEAGGNK